ncbi:hypothetical protein WME76_02075 [Sorangium sp. So ce119]|uniref:hypothetical protein n=1 Tax=Sorangium sp. So ce119 TaxID=3133279 RepID=UPI003F5F0810
MGLTMAYAKGTEVSVERSKAELDGLLSRAGATQRGVVQDDVAGTETVVFAMAGRHVRLALPLPKLASVVVRSRGRRSWEEARRRAWEQQCRERWRAMVLLVKAKLETIALGLSTVEREFLADLYLPDGSTVGEALRPQLEEAYRSGSMPKLLGP